jgi:hypothetical protein
MSHPVHRKSKQPAQSYDCDFASLLKDSGDLNFPKKNGNARRLLKIQAKSHFELCAPGNLFFFVFGGGQDI